MVQNEPWSKGLMQIKPPPYSLHCRTPLGWRDNLVEILRVLGPPLYIMVLSTNLWSENTLGRSCCHWLLESYFNSPSIVWGRRGVLLTLMLWGQGRKLCYCHQPPMLWGQVQLIATDQLLWKGGEYLIATDHQSFGKGVVDTDHWPPRFFKGEEILLPLTIKTLGHFLQLLTSNVRGNVSHAPDPCTLYSM